MKLVFAETEKNMGLLYGSHMGNPHMGPMWTPVVDMGPI